MSRTRQSSATARAPRRARQGFTLIELMVVVVIIGMVVAGAVLAIGTTGSDTQLEEERDRLSAMTQYVRERGELQTREYGLRVAPDTYQFVVFEPRTSVWMIDDLDSSLHQRLLPTGLHFSLLVEGREVVIDPPPSQGKLESSVPDLTPQIMLFSNGDTSDFALTLTRAVGSRSVTLKSAEDGRIAVGAIETSAK